MNDRPGPAASSAVMRAAELVKACPLRWSEDDDGRPESEVMARGWFGGARECARVLAGLTSGEVEFCWGFGGEWPVLRGREGTIGPAVPAVVHHEAVIGPDGEYRGDESGIWRESVGVEESYLTFDRSRSSPGRPFDLLWYGESERYLVRQSTLEIEDLFGRLRVPATAGLLDRYLIRRRRLDDCVISDLQLATADGPQSVVVQRPVSLSRHARWRDVERFLSNRPDVVSAEWAGDIVEAVLHDGVRVAFRHDEDADGWRLELRDGRYPLTEIRLAGLGGSIRATAIVSEGIDALAPGMRGRLVFDLRADLVALG